MEHYKDYKHSSSMRENRQKRAHINSPRQHSRWCDAGAYRARKVCKNFCKIEMRWCDDAHDTRNDGNGKMNNIAISVSC